MLFWWFWSVLLRQSHVERSFFLLELEHAELMCFCWIWSMQIAELMCLVALAFYGKQLLLKQALQKYLTIKVTV